MHRILGEKWIDTLVFRKYHRDQWSSKAPKKTYVNNLRIIMLSHRLMDLMKHFINIRLDLQYSLENRNFINPLLIKVAKVIFRTTRSNKSRLITWVRICIWIACYSQGLNQNHSLRRQADSGQKWIYSTKV